MEKLGKKLTKLISLCIVLIMIMSTLMINFSYATEVRVVTDEAEKEKLLGISSQRAREKSILGLANEFSLFTNGNVTTYGSDIEGRLAANGTVDFNGTGSYNWKYQVGCGYNNYGPNTTGTAEVIANGSVLNLNVNSGSTTNGNSYEATKTVVAQKIDDTDPTSEVKGWGYQDNEVDKFVKADLIDFDSEFQWLNSQSQMLANMTTNLGTIEKKSVKYFVPAVYKKGQPDQKNMYEVVNGNMYYYTQSYAGGSTIDYERMTREVVTFTGTNNDFNIFNISVSEFNQYFSQGQAAIDSSLFNNSYDVIFNVPEGSSIIINVKGTDVISFCGSYKLDRVDMGYTGEYPYTSQPQESVYKRMLMPYSEEDIAKDENLKDKFGMYLYDENTKDFVRDSEGNYVLFVDIANEKQNEKVKKILYNVPEATSITLKDNFLGSILAPNADATNPSDKSMSAGCCGHLSGNLICKSYTGTMEFGFLPTSAQINDVKYTVNVAKLDKDTKERVSGAELQLYTLNSDKIEKITDNTNPTLLETWTSGEEDKVFKLAPGGYYIVEKTAPDNFEKEEAKTYFTVEENGDITKNFNTKKELLNYNKVNLYDKVNLNGFSFNYESILPNITNLNPTYKYRTPSISFTLTTDDESLKGKEYAVHIGTNYNAFRNETIFSTQSGGTSSNFYTQMIQYSKIKEGTEATFSIPVYGWAGGLNVNLYDENNQQINDKSKFSFTNVSANVPTMATKTYSASEENSSIYDKYTISITNKKVEKEEPVQQEPEKTPEKEPEKTPEKAPEKEPEQTPEQPKDPTPEQPKDEVKQEEPVTTPKEETPVAQEVKKETSKLSPKTGDQIILCIVILGVSCIVFIITGKKKVKNQKKDKK